MTTSQHPPLYTTFVEITGWSLDRTAALPKSQRFTFGQRIDNRTLDAVQLIVRAIYSARPKKAPLLAELNLVLEELRVLWRLVHDRRWISQQQLFHIIGRLDEAGRMTGGWLASLSKDR
ncbi:MAG: four helix bundle protein [Opitutaceae bacterium]